MQLGRLKLQESAELLASVELQAKDELPDEDDDVPAALERLELLASLERHELPASVELRAKVELLAADELLGERDDMKAAPAGRDELPDEGDDLHEARERFEPGLGRAAGRGRNREEGDDLQAALERLEFPASVELLATVSC